MAGRKPLQSKGPIAGCKLLQQEHQGLLMRTLKLVATISLQRFVSLPKAIMT